MKKNIFKNLCTCLFASLIFLNTTPTYGMMGRLRANASTVQLVTVGIVATAILYNLFKFRKINTPSACPPLEIPSTFLVDDAITLLYQGYKPNTVLSLSEQELATYKEGDDLKKLVTAQGIISYIFPQISRREWSDEDWQAAYDSIKENPPTIIRNNNRHLSLKESVQLRTDAQTILECFLVTEKINTKDFIKKSGINRLFTYAKLHSIIQQKRLAHVHLPRKILAIKHKPSNQFITDQAAKTLLPTLLDMYVTGTEDPITHAFYPEICIHYNRCRLEEYDFLIFAEKQINYKKLSTIALQELIELVKEAPFDIGYDNIFATENGDAVIIDTEFKGELSKASVPKLIDRYTCTPEQKKELSEIWENYHPTCI